MALFVKLDTTFWEHPKVLAAGEQAAVLYLQMLCYAQANLTDGFVPDAQLGRFGIRKATVRVAKLIDSELIQRRSEDDGWSIVGYTERNRSRAEVEQIREKRRSAGVQGGRASGQARSKVLHGDEANGKQVASTATNPEYREQSSEFRDPSPSTSDQRPAPAGPPEEGEREPTATTLMVELLDLTGLVGANANLGEVRTVERALANGWPPAELRAMAVRASQALVDPRAYLAQCLARAMNDPPPDAAPAEPRPLLHDQRPPCANPDCVDGWVGGLGPDGRPEPTTRCPSCTGVRA